MRVAELEITTILEEETSARQDEYIDKDELDIIKDSSLDDDCFSSKDEADSLALQETPRPSQSSQREEEDNVFESAKEIELEDFGFVWS